MAKIEENKNDALKDALTGAAAGTAAALITNPLAQVSNMKASHPEKYMDAKWIEVVKDLWKKPRYTKDQRIIANQLSDLESAHRIANSRANKDLTLVKDLAHEITTRKNQLESMNPKTMKLRAFYSGFGSKALNNALFSAAMFGSIGMFKKMYDEHKNKRLHITETNG